MNKDKEKLKVKCKFCGYDWETKSKLLYITCPNCRKKSSRFKAHKKMKGGINKKENGKK